MWQKLRLYCACQWGEGEQAGQGSTCRAKAGLRASSSFHQHGNGAPGPEREENARGPTRVKLRSAGPPHPGGHSKLKPWALCGFGRSLKDLLGGLKAP